MLNKLLLLSFLLISCSRPTKDVGKIESGYEILCLQEELNSGFNTAGDAHVTTQCIRSECFHITRKLGKNYFQWETLKQELVDIKNCAKEIK